MKSKHRTCRECQGMYWNLYGYLSCPVEMTEEDFYAMNENDYPAAA
ncbi:hypothetical protein HNQ80_000857 [Anaerosolibacter carboniphilus]|uniref:Uncharacterized protein n=1 Tax=Anaerosolibacter carboniphilus TaxID=1417629 RepID=A0A841KV27_9FIRM|nr:hypothetical protein [Anaerosolibacter carboniphilus]MBB6214772.1 hypothetical protein [Anaerosolibacter carboniphilus]